MKVLMLSRDAKIFEKGSAVRARMIEYGKLFDTLHICVISRGTYEKEKISPTITVFHEPISSLWLFWRILKKVPQDIDLVTSQDPFETGLLALVVSKKLRAPLQLQIHTDFLNPYFKKESVKNFIRCLLAKITIPRADCIRVVSEKIFNSLSHVTCHMSHVSIIPIWVDYEKIKNAPLKIFPKKFDFTILWVGRLEREKNCAFAIEAFSQVLKKIPDAGLTIIGDGSERKHLELYAKRYTLNAQVIFMGWKNDIAGYYKSADALLVTSRYEGYGVSMVEARIAGIPVVAPDVGVAREVGAYITEYTPDSIVKTLVRLYKKELPIRAKYEYPYGNKEQYLKLYKYKESFEQCLSR